MNFQNLSSLRKYLTLTEHKAGTLKVKIKASALGDPIVKDCIAEFKKYTHAKSHFRYKRQYFYADNHHKI